MPSAGQNSSPTVRTVSYRSASSPGSPQAAIQLADSRMSSMRAMSAAAMLVTASADGHAAGSSGIEQRERRALAHRHRLAVLREVVAHGHGDVADRHLPGPDQRVAADHAADRAVADRDQEGLVGDRRQPQQPERRIAHVDATAIEVVARARQAPHVARHARRLAEQRRRAACPPACCRTADPRRAASVVGHLADHRERAALALAQRAELPPAAPPRRSARSAPAPRCTRSRAATCRARRSAPCAGRRDRRSRPCATDSGTAFDRPPAPTSWISRIGLSSPSAQQPSMTSCARRWISGLPRCTEAKSRSAELAPAPTDEAAPPPRPISIAGPPSTTTCAPGTIVGLLDVLPADVAEAARDHDRLVVAAQRRAAGGLDALLERAEIAADAGTPELVVERGRADRTLEHDLQRGGDAVRLAEVLLPGLHRRPGCAGSRR